MSPKLIRTIRLIALVALALALLPGNGAGVIAETSVQGKTPNRQVCEGVTHLAPEGAALSGVGLTAANNMTEGFEGIWPSTGWTLTDGYSPAQYLPGDRDCEAFWGLYSLWMHGGGFYGSALDCGDPYPTDINTWAIYGPFDLSGMTYASLTLVFSGTTEIQYSGVCGDYDYFFFGASTDGVAYTGNCFSGEWINGPDNGWHLGSLDLSSYLGESQVWIALEFRSDWSDVAGGVFFDNLVLTSSGDAVTETPTPTDTSTPSETTAPTVTNTPTVTPTLTLAPTDTVAPTMTTAPTDTATTEPTYTVTPTATTEPSATATATIETPAPTETSGPYPTPETPTTEPTTDPYPSPATATPTATPTFTPSPTAVGIIQLPLVFKNGSAGPLTDLIVNGGFETDDAWNLPATAWTASYATDEVHSCARSVFCGIFAQIDNVFSYSSTNQWVTIPADASYAQLEFWAYSHSTEPRLVSLSSGVQNATTLEGLRHALATTGTDLQYVVLLRQGYPMVKLLNQCADDAGWQQYSFDVSAYAGERVGVHFEVYNDGWDGVTSMHVDDVSLMVR